MDIYVYADWVGINGPLLMGTLTVVHTRGHHVVSFDYDKEWIKHGFAQNLDPDLQFYSGPQYLGKGKTNFGVFMDSSPDRWGKTLMDRREAIVARQEGRKPRKLFEEDYLLGVYDDFVTPEQVKPEELDKFAGTYFETCQTFSGSWGYFRDENTWKTNHQLLTLLITATSRGGNLILNVGPTADLR